MSVSPAEEEEWSQALWEDLKEDEFVMWFAFFIVGRDTTASFVMGLEATLDEIDDKIFEIGSQKVGAYGCRCR
jgi:hypothetical protein